MNQTLTGIAIAVVVAIVIALVAPFLIDWSSYRGSVESRAADILGRQVRIEGDMELRLLPQPVLRARNVVAGDGETPDITIEQLDMTMSLTPLLSGEISVSEATISQPVIHLSVDDAGRLTLGGGGDFPVDPENVSLDHVEVRGGLVLMDDARSGTVTRFENVNLTGSAVSLLGPLKLEGSAVHDGVVNSFSLQTGRVTPDSALRVKLGVIPANRPVAFDSDGVLTIEEGAPVFNGRIRLEGLDLNDARQLKGPVWRIDADVRGTGGSVEAKKATLTVGDPDSGPALEGDGMLTLGGDPRLTVNLSTRQVDLDRHLGGGDQTSIPVLLGKLAEVVAAIDVPVPVEATLDIGGIVAGGVLFENLKADVASADGGWRIGGLRVDGPGGARLALSGKLDLAGTAPAFEGRGVINARNGTASMLALAGRGDIPGLGRPDGPVSGEADISLSTDRLYLNGMSLRYDDTNLTGDLAYVHTDGERKRLTLDVDADRLDADGLGALLSQVAGGAGGLDVEARLKIASLLSGSTDIGAVSLDTSFDGRQFTLNELKVAGANGTRIDGKGALQGLDDQPSGDIAVDVEAGSIGAVAALVEAFGRPDVALALRQRGEGLAPLKLAFALKGAHAGAGTAVTLSASGRAGGGPLDLKLGFEGDFSSWRTGRAELTLDAENPDGSALLALTGIQMTMPGDAAGSLSLKLSGTPSTGLDTTALFTGAGLRFDLAGKSIVGDTGIVLDGVRLVATADDPVLAAAGFGIDVPGGAGQGPASAKGTLGGPLKDLSLQKIEGDWQGNGFIGYIDLDRQQARPKISGQLSIGDASLAGLGALALGEDAFGARRPWPDDVIPAATLLPVDLQFTINAAKFDLGAGLIADTAGFLLKVDAGEARIGDLRGTIHGGALAGGMSIKPSPDGALFESNLTLNGARLEELVWQRDGRPVASGSADLTIVASGAGRSLAGIVASLGGSGSIALRDGRLNGLNPAAFEQVVTASDAGLNLDEARVREVFGGHLASGGLDFDRLEGAFSIAGGVARAERVAVDTKAASTFVTGRVDLNNMSLDAVLSLSTASETDKSEGRQREAALIFSGPLASPSRRIDVSALMGYLTVREFEREVDRLETLQEDINERQFFSRELLREGEQRRRREREAVEAGRRAEEARAAADAKKAEEARKAAEEQKLREAEAARAEAERKARETLPPPPAQTELERAIQDAVRSAPAQRAPVIIRPRENNGGSSGFGRGSNENIDREPLPPPHQLVPPR